MAEISDTEMDLVLHDFTVLMSRQVKQFLHDGIEILLIAEAPHCTQRHEAVGPHRQKEGQSEDSGCRPTEYIFRLKASALPFMGKQRLLICSDPDPLSSAGAVLM